MEKDFMVEQLVELQNVFDTAYDELVELQKVFDNAYDAVGDIIDAIETKEEEDREFEFGLCTIGDETFYVARYLDTGELVRAEMSDA